MSATHVCFLRRLGLAELIDGPSLTTFADIGGRDNVRAAIHRFVNESVFQPNKNDIPRAWQHPILAMVYQFKSYPTMLGRMTKWAVSEALARETLPDGRKVYAGNVKPLIYLLSVGAALGAGAQGLRDVVAGRGGENSDEHALRERSLSRLVQNMGFKDFEMSDPEADKLLGWWIEGIMGLGALGLIGDTLYQSAANLDNGSFGRERIASLLGGPSVGGFFDVLNVAGGASDFVTGGFEVGDANAKERSAVRAVVNRVPFAGKARSFTEAVVSYLAGEPQER